MPSPRGLLPNLAQDVLHHRIRDIESGPAQVLDNRCCLCDPPHGLGPADNAERPDDLQPHRLGAASPFRAVEDQAPRATAQTAVPMGVAAKMPASALVRGRGPAIGGRFSPA